MEIIILIFIAFALAMDAFAVSIAYGAVITEPNFGNGFRIAGAFGGFQALMPIFGWFLGKSFFIYISGYDHWIAFFILILVGGRMIYEALRSTELKGWFDHLRLGVLISLSIATSIDALVTGVSFSLLNISIVRAIIIIGLITFFLSLTGVYTGRWLGRRFKNWIKGLAGVMLIMIGIRVLIEHLVE